MIDYISNYSRYTIFGLAISNIIACLTDFIFSINIVRADIASRNAGMEGINKYYKSFSSFDSGRGWGTGSSFPHKPLTFSCMRCGNQHNKVACPK